MMKKVVVSGSFDDLNSQYMYNGQGKGAIDCRNDKEVIG
jgi:hypothetical protein